MTQLLKPDDFAFAHDAAIVEAVRQCYVELYRRGVVAANKAGVLVDGKPWPDVSRHRLPVVRTALEKVNEALEVHAKPEAPQTKADSLGGCHAPDNPNATDVMVLGADGVMYPQAEPVAVCKPDAALATEAQRGAIEAMAQKLGVKPNDVIPVPLAQLTKTQASETLDRLRAKLVEQQNAPGAPVGKSLFLSLIKAAQDKGLAVDEASREARLEATNEVLTHSGLPMVTSWKQLGVEQYNALYRAIADGDVSWTATETELTGSTT